jgi:hypothetical protein
MRVIGSKITTAAVAAAMIFTPTAAVSASMPPAPAQTARSPWLTLSMLDSWGTVGLAGAAAQPATDVPPPPPPPEAPPPSTDGNSISGVPLPVIGVWLAGIVLAVYIATRNHHGRFVFPTSPA